MVWGVVAALAAATIWNRDAGHLGPPPRPVANAAGDYFARNDPDSQSMLVPWDLLPTLHYYQPRLTLTSYGNALGSDEIVDLVSSRRFDGLLYVGPDRDGIDDRLRRRFPSHVAHFVEEVADGVSVVHYELRAGQP